ncbi:nuclease 1 [Phytophthora palmivora]|uniref:Exonuclease 1 n=1 Tax=Phytophthora palmivora TaxID=4796 RepID=A0A2P4XV62_9STRA|nr:nuclease 1 [Phytophthora palmivora]
MGVAGLLPVLKSVTDQVHVSKYAGKTAGVDASGWLYKGAYSCAVDLVLERKTDAYLNFSMERIKLLQEHNITPILVFDGAPLPAKAQENASRGRSRADWKLKAKKLLQENNEDQDSGAVYAACKRALSVTNEMVMTLIAALRRMNITFYVAPYEADAQLAFLSRQKIVDVVISEDADCIPYGVKTVLFKLNQDGWGSELKRRSLGANEELSFVGWTEEMFIQLCVLAGCDYCPSIPTEGIITP